MIRRTVSAIAALVLASSLSACSDDKKDPKPKATDPTPSASPTPTKPAWQDAYSTTQLDGYNAALQRWESYLNRSEPIWAAGKATPQAEDLFKEYFPDPQWRGLYAQLETYERADATVAGVPTVFWSRAKKISADGLSTTIEQCVDYSAPKSAQGGKPLDPAPWTKTPRIRTVALAKPRDQNWLVYRLQSDINNEQRPAVCEP